ncbi:unnamed protein product [Rotaria sp. Silwood2]|nr:unnamed protein product [Rotaria sp. Silwood2]CAF4288639.1 unnamed protein product [Rotaria sp. Silwood2]
MLHIKVYIDLIVGWRLTASVPYSTPFRLDFNSGIPINAEWIQNGTIITGEQGRDRTNNQVYWPEGLFIDDDQTIVIADSLNHRIVQWNVGDTNGKVVAGGHGEGNRLYQLKYPTDVLIDIETNSLIICDEGNRRVVQWSRLSGTIQGEILLNNICCRGLAMDDQRYLYISDIEKHEVRRYQIGDKNGTVVAGGHGKGTGLNQLNEPTYVFVDREQAVYVSEWNNHRVMKWDKDAKEGIIVAGGQGKGNSLAQLSCPNGLFVDTFGTVYVVDSWNHRVMRWPKGAKQGTVIMGGKGQLHLPIGLSFDRHGNFYVAEKWNHRVQRFSMKGEFIARWAQNGVTVAGGHGHGSATYQLCGPWGLFINDDQTMVIADSLNHRIVQWNIGDTNGKVVAGGHGEGNRLYQLKYPTDVLIDVETNSLIICDRQNRRVVQWCRCSGINQGEILFDKIDCFGVTMDDQRYLYISDIEKHEVRRYRIGNKNGTVVAGGHGKGTGLNQLNEPTYVFVDREQAVYVSDRKNHRVMKWDKGSKEGVIVAGGQDTGERLTQLSYPYGLFVDTSDSVYVADYGNDRVMCWPKGAKQGTVIVDGNSRGVGTNQLCGPWGLFFDRHNNLYVSDNWNHRVQRFSKELTSLL